MTRRAHFKIVVGAEVLRNVGFGAQELLDLRFSPRELKDGACRPAPPSPSLLLSR